MTEDQMRADAEAEAGRMNPRIMALGNALDEAADGKTVHQMLEMVGFVVACQLDGVLRARPQDALGLATFLQVALANAIASLNDQAAREQADEDLKAAARNIPAEELAAAFGVTYATDDAHANAIPAHEPHPVLAAVEAQVAAAAEADVPVPALPDAGAGDVVEALDPFPKTAESVEHVAPLPASKGA